MRPRSQISWTLRSLIASSQPLFSTGTTPISNRSTPKSRRLRAKKARVSHARRLPESPATIIQRISNHAVCLAVLLPVSHKNFDSTFDHLRHAQPGTLSILPRSTLRTLHANSQHHPSPRQRARQLFLERCYKSPCGPLYWPPTGTCRHHMRDPRLRYARCLHLALPTLHITSTKRRKPKAALRCHFADHLPTYTKTRSSSWPRRLHTPSSPPFTDLTPCTLATSFVNNGRRSCLPSPKPRPAPALTWRHEGPVRR